MCEKEEQKKERTIERRMTLKEEEEMMWKTNVLARVATTMRLMHCKSQDKLVDILVVIVARWLAVSFARIANNKVDFVIVCFRASSHEEWNGHLSDSAYRADETNKKKQKNNHKQRRAVKKNGMGVSTSHRNKESSHFHASQIRSAN